MKFESDVSVSDQVLEMAMAIGRETLPESDMVRFKDYMVVAITARMLGGRVFYDYAEGFEFAEEAVGKFQK